MSEDLREQGLIDRGLRAEKILKHELYAESFAAVKAAIHEKIEASPVRDVEGREHLFKMLKALNDARGYLEQAMRDGKVSLHLKEEKRLLKFFR